VPTPTSTRVSTTAIRRIWLPMMALFTTTRGVQPGGLWSLLLVSRSSAAVVGYPPAATCWTWYSHSLPTSLASGVPLDLSTDAQTTYMPAQRRRWITRHRRLPPRVVPKAAPHRGWGSGATLSICMQPLQKRQAAGQLRLRPMGRLVGSTAASVSRTTGSRLTCRSTVEGPYRKPPQVPTTELHP
jgi:hypothetical protein